MQTCAEYEEKKKKFVCGPDIPFIVSDMLITYTGRETWRNCSVYCSIVLLL